MVLKSQQKKKRRERGGGKEINSKLSARLLVKILAGN
jgi:hypothetical protein